MLGEKKENLKFYIQEINILHWRQPLIKDLANNLSKAAYITKRDNQTWCFSFGKYTKLPPIPPSNWPESVQDYRVNHQFIGNMVDREPCLKKPHGGNMGA